jgi:hypothetical protein
MEEETPEEELTWSESSWDPDDLTREKDDEEEIF